MASRRIALVFTHRGPWVSTRAIRNPWIRCFGLKENLIRLRQKTGEDYSASIELPSSGSSKIPESDWMMVEYLGSNAKGLIVDIVSNAEYLKSVFAA